MPIIETTLLITSEKPVQTQASKYDILFSKICKKVETPFKPKKHEVKFLFDRTKFGEENFTWWTKFYNSMNHHSDDKEPTLKHKLVIFDRELEKQSEYRFLQDWAETMHIYRRRSSTRSQRNSGSEVYASLKCFLRIEKSLTKLNGPENVFEGSHTGSYSDLTALNNEKNVMIRIYLVQGLNLRSQDVFNSSDTYVRIEYGAKKVRCTIFLDICLWFMPKLIYPGMKFGSL